MTLLANVEDLGQMLSASAQTGTDPAVGKWVNGRIVAVLGSPELGNAEELAIGVSLLSAGTSTPRHDHRAEEIAVILAGSGEIVLGDEVIPVTRGDIVRTPPHLPHQTIAGSGSELQVLWIYAPAGSENRWLQNAPKE